MFLANLLYFFCCKSIWPVVDPSWPLHDLWPQQCITLWSRVLPTKFGGLRAFLSNLTSGWPWLTPTWPLTPPMHYTQVRGSSYQSLVVIGHSWAIWSLVDPGWPLRDLRPQQCITLWSGVLPTKFGSHRAFLRQIDLWMTFDLWSGRFEKLTHKPQGPIPYHPTKFQLDAS